LALAHRLVQPYLLCSADTISFFFYQSTPASFIYSLSLHDALPILHDDFGVGVSRQMVVGHRQQLVAQLGEVGQLANFAELRDERSEEHTSELQSRENLVCRLLLEKKKNNKQTIHETQHPHHTTRSA